MKNKWLIAAAAVGIHISIGSVYAWSVFVNPIINELGFSLKEVQWIFSLAIFSLGTSAAFLGKFVEKYGPRKAGIIAAGCFGAGMIGSSMAITAHSLFALYFFYGVVGGIGLGLGYITPVGTLVKWFPEQKGFATGLAIMGFGFAALVAGPIIQTLIGEVGLSMTFGVMGVIYCIVMLLSALYLEPPKFDTSAEVELSTPSFTAQEALQTKEFYMLWMLLFINITCGIALISVASPMAQEVVHMSPLAAATMVGIIGLFNGFGRFLWAFVSDYIGRPLTYIAFFVIQIVAFLLLSDTTNILLFQLLMYAIISCYGGGFSAMPAYLSDLYGTKQLSAIHGYILTAWAAAGIAGPLLIAIIKEATNSYTGTLYAFVSLFTIALIVACFLKSRIESKLLFSR